MEISGKTALVTSAQRRIGREIALGLAAAGANIVVAHYEETELAEETTNCIQEMGVGALQAWVDVSDKLSVTKLVEQALSHFGSVDILINAASYYSKVPFPNPDTSNWERSLGVLLNGPFYLANALAPKMLENGQGVIINICDLSSLWECWPDYTGHVVGKAGLWALTRQLALELAPKVRANGIAPGPILPPPHYDEAKIVRTADKTLLNTWGSPQDIVRTVIFIIENDYLTGELIHVDGGQRFAHRKHEEG
ncbi:MAG: SDR family oxidoreductase [Anaerolineaceae bacterium]|nr:SDR family oxidoreductase [Anaerolineaceae bacterium]